MSASPNANRYANLELKMECPNCGSGGMIPWKQLDHVLMCHGCNTRYRVQASGLVEMPQSQEDRIRIQVRTNSSEWRDHSAVLVRAPRWGAWLRDLGLAFVLRGRTRWVAAATLLILVVVSAAIAGRKPTPPPPLVIPDSLEGRAAMFTEALVRRDMPLIVRLTDPDQHRALRIWLAHGTGLPEPSTPADSPPQAEIVSNVAKSATGDIVDVRVRLPASGDSKETVLDEQWVQRNEVWYFQPELVRSPTAVRSGPVRPYVKPRRFTR